MLNKICLSLLFLPLICVLTSASKPSGLPIERKEVPLEFGTENTVLVFIHGWHEKYDQESKERGAKYYHGPKIYLQEIELKKYPLDLFRYAIVFSQKSHPKGDGTDGTAYKVEILDRKTNERYDRLSIGSYTRDLKNILSRLEEMRVQHNVIPTSEELPKGIEYVELPPPPSVFKNDMNTKWIIYNPVGGYSGETENQYSEFEKQGKLKKIKVKSDRSIFGRYNTFLMVQDDEYLYISPEFWGMEENEGESFDWNVDGWDALPLTGTEIGKKYPDIELKLRVTVKPGQSDSQVKIVLSDREYIGEAEVQTGMGILDCHVISLEVKSTSMGISVSRIIKCYYTAEQGIVKTETYKKKGGEAKQISVLMDMTEKPE